jgi:nicotinamidase-related amidase
MSTATTALPLPGYYDPSGVADTDRWLDYGSLAEQAVAYRKANGIRPAALDAKKIGFLNIDTQVTFCHPRGELSVDGAVEDTQRVVEFVYRNLGTITAIDCTLDTHRAYAVFHPAFVIDSDGNNAPPYTPITYAEVRDGKWKASPYMASALNVKLMTAENQLMDYTHKLEQSGRYALMIWPYHAMLGGKGHNLMPGLEEASFFHSIVRGSQTHFEVKGTNTWTENYSVLGPEVTSLSDGKGVPRNASFIKKLLDYDYLVIAGQAKSHCVAWTIDDLLNEIQQSDPALAAKVYLLEDCTSPVVTPAYDLTPEANAAFGRFRAAGMHLVKSTDAIEDWEGVEL